MFKTLLTFARGRAAATTEHLADSNALILLDQQMRDACAALDRAKRALALAMANDQHEAQRLDGLNDQITDLEQRVVSALGANSEHAAEEGAEAIARLEAQRDAIETARSLFAAEITRLKKHVSQAEVRIAEVDCGRRIAHASEAVRDLRRGRFEAAPLYQATLVEAEATLQRLRERQIEARTAEELLDQLDVATAPMSIAEKLAEQGFGPKIKSTANDVLTRLSGSVARNALPDLSRAKVQSEDSAVATNPSAE
jgi:phage shock protein A